MSFEIKPATRIEGSRFGRLTVFSETQPAGRWKFKIKCRCDCGKEKFIREDHLKSGRSTSCGCYSSELSQSRNATHGDSRRKVKRAAEFTTWSKMTQRCHNPNDKSYPRYGGRGIQVCQAWRDSYETFLAAVGRRPSPLHSIERLKNGENYEPGNCVWATKKEHANNRRTNHRLTLNGITKTAAQWQEMTGIKSLTILRRISLGWTEEKALTEPLRITRRPA